MEGGLIAERLNLGQELGRGGYGVVRAVRYKPDLAVKYASGPRWNLGDDAIIREAGILQVLEGIPGVPRLLAFGAEGGRPWLAMPRLRGPWLDQVQLQWPGCLAVWLAVALRLQAAHDLGLVHRDVKPGNICLEGAPVLADWGLSWIRGHRELPVHPDYWLGSPYWTDPGTVEDRVEPVPGHDTWSMGALLHWCVHGETLVDGVEIGQILFRGARGLWRSCRGEIVQARNLCLVDRNLEAAIDAVTGICEETGVL